MKTILYALLFFILTQAIVHAQPGIVWERTYFNSYYTTFYDVHETFDGGFIVAGNLTDFSSEDNEIVFRMDSDGNVLWMFGHEDWWGQSTRWIEELPDQGFIATGGGTAYSGDDPYLHILRLDADGNEIWTKIYDIDDVDVRGQCITLLPDGGFAVCGIADPDTGMADGWILRTDSNGDTLWARSWGWDFYDRAMKVLYIDDGLSVLTNGRLEGDPGGTYIVRYDMDGNLLWENQIEDEMIGKYGWDMCYSSSDNGYTIVTRNGPFIAHTDSLGMFQWIVPGRGASNPLGYSINATMDQGYIYAGQSRPDPEIPGTTYSGMIVKYDSEGNEMWWDYVYNSDCDGLFSARQLSQGGYIAAGIANSLTTSREGYLIRYEPEVGIEGGVGFPGTVQLGVLPNPFASSLSISFNLPEPAQIELSIYDPSGRLVEDLVSGSLLAGEHNAIWNPDPILPSGCYLIVLDACGQRAVRRCVKLD